MQETLSSQGAGLLTGQSLVGPSTGGPLLGAAISVAMARVLTPRPSLQRMAYSFHLFMMSSLLFLGAVVICARRRVTDLEVEDRCPHVAGEVGG